MKKYEYVTVHMAGVFNAEQNEHRRIIDEYAAKGYRYAGYIPIYFDTDGNLREMDLVFEIDC